MGKERWKSTRRAKLLRRKINEKSSKTKKSTPEYVEIDDINIKWKEDYKVFIKFFYFNFFSIKSHL